MSDSSLVQLYGLKESAWGVTPASALKALRMTGESLGFNIESTTSNEIRSDRQIIDLVQTGAEASGGFNFELSHGTYDEYFEAALGDVFSAELSLAGTDVSASDVDNSFNATVIDLSTIAVGQWIKVAGFTTAANNGYFKTTSVTSTKVIVDSTLVTEAAGDSVTIDGSMVRNGTTKMSFSLEKFFSDITQYISFTGMRVSTMDLNFAVGAILAGSFNFIGKDSAIAATTIGTGAPTAATTTDVMNAISDLQNIREGGAEISGTFIQSLSLSLNAGARPQKGIGYLGNVGVGLGRINITGNLTAYFENETLYNKYVNNTESSVDFRLEDGTNAYIFTLPRLKFTTGEVLASGADADVIASMGYQAIRDAITDCTIQIDRF